MRRYGGGGGGRWEMALMDPFNICSRTTEHQRYAHARRLRARPDLASAGFDRVTQSKHIILILEAITAPLIRTLLFPPILQPQRLSSIYIYQRDWIIHHIYQMLAHIAALYRLGRNKKKKNTGIEKIPSLIELNPIHLSQKQAVPGARQKFLLGWVFPYRRSGDLGNAWDFKDGGV